MKKISFGVFLKTFIIRSFLAVSFSCFLVGEVIAESDQRTAALVPVVMLLLAEDGPIILTVGQENVNTYDSSDYPQGIEFQYSSIAGDLRLTLNVSNISAGAQLEIYINGQLIGNLSNGDNTFSIPGSGANKNVISIRFKDGSTGAWTINRILGLLSNGPQTRAEAQRFLTRATFGPRLSEIDRVLAIGYEAWIDEQIALPATLTIPYFNQALVDRVANRRVRWVAEGVTDPDMLDNPDLGASQIVSSRLDSWFNATINGEDQLRQRMAFALSEIFSVGDNFGDGVVSTRRFTQFQDVLIGEALGNYGALLKEVTVDVAMAVWLSFSGSLKGDEVAGTAADENYAREVQQLFTIGLVELNMDGSPKLDASGNAIETYNPELVGQFARVFTGWNWPTRPSTNAEKIVWESQPLVPWLFHDVTEKRLHVYPGTTGINAAGLGQEADLDRALGNLFNHPNVAPFVAKQLIQRLVTSNPSPEYIERVATVFDDNNGVRGDLAATAKAILLDPEALNSHTMPLGGKVKEPLLRLTQIWRTFEAKSLGRYIRYALPERVTGQRPIGAATVFSFFPPDYAPTGDIEDNGMVAPELLLTDGRLQVDFINGLSSIVRSTSGDTNPHPLYSESFSIAMVLDLSEAKLYAASVDGLINFVDERLFGGLMSEQLRSSAIEYLIEFELTGTQDEQRKQLVEEALVVLTASPEYSIQR